MLLPNTPEVAEQFSFNELGLEVADRSLMVMSQREAKQEYMLEFNLLMANRPTT